jgi:arylsulfatase A-like enzyme
MEPHAPYTPQKIGDYVETHWNMRRITDANRKIVNKSRQNMNLRGKKPNQNDLEKVTNEDIEICRKMYGHMINYVDLELSKFISKLKNRSDYNDNIIVILSDHGEAFGEGGVFTHDWTANPIDVLLKVPLIVKFPQNEITDTFGHLVQSADIIATIIELLDLDAKRPNRTHQLTDNRDRIVVSKSNTAIRITTPDAVAIRRGQEITELRGDLPRKYDDLLHSQKIPNVASLNGVVPKGNDDEVLKQLEYLGYI